MVASSFPQTDEKASIMKSLSEQIDVKELGDWKQAKRTVNGLIKVYMEMEYPSFEIRTFMKKIIDEVALLNGGIEHWNFNDCIELEKTLIFGKSAKQESCPVRTILAPLVLARLGPDKAFIQNQNQAINSI